MDIYEVEGEQAQRIADLRDIEWRDQMEGWSDKWKNEWGTLFLQRQSNNDVQQRLEPSRDGPRHLTFTAQMMEGVCKSVYVCVSESEWDILHPVLKHYAFCLNLSFLMHMQICSLIDINTHSRGIATHRPLDLFLLPRQTHTHIHTHTESLMKVSHTSG